MIDKLNKFVDENNLEFTVGRRNSDLTVLCGYALYLESEGKYKEDTKFYLIKFLHSLPHSDSELMEELDKVYKYANEHHYETWWKDVANREQYVV